MRVALTSAMLALALLAATPALAAAEAVPSASAQLLRLVLGLLAVVAAVFVLSRLLPRLGGRALTGSRGFRVVASLPVGQRERVVILEVGDRQILVGVAPGRVSKLHEFDEPLARGVAAAAGDDAATGWLARTLGGRSQ